MAIPVNLAMTAAEFCFCHTIPPEIAWMACHFSSDSHGLSNLPPILPRGSLLVLDDQTPMDGHDPERVGAELAECAKRFACCGVLLDFQRPGAKEISELVQHLTGVLPCPVAVTALYAQGNNAAVFLPPLPCHTPLKDWTAPWAGRELWLELALDQEIISLTGKGAEIAAGDFDESKGFADEKLHCHYQASVEEDRAEFKLWRTREDLGALLEEAEELCIKRAVGLYQELGNHPAFRSCPI